MHSFHIDNMTRKVLAALDLDETKYQFVRDAIAAEWEDTIALTWCVDDVLGKAKESGRYISKQAARDLLQSIYYDHDCSMGVSWSTIDIYLDEDTTPSCPDCGGNVAIHENGDAVCDKCGYKEVGYVNL